MRPDNEAEPLLEDRYRLLRLIGSGGVAEVFEANDERLLRRVAIKRFRGDAADELQRHESEMRMLAQLDHPALVTVYDAGSDPDDRPFLVMQLIEGTTLASELARRGALPLEQVADWGATLAAGLAYVHGQGVVHRDVKPANVLLGRDGRVHLADFGIARLVDSAAVTRAGDVVGSPAYFSPEQVAGELVGPAADVYALGLLLLECLTGKREFEGPAMEAAMARLARDPEIPASLPIQWQSLLTAMLARTPTQRPLASEVSSRLTALSALDTASVPVAAAPTQAVPQITAVPPTTATTRMPVADATVAAPMATTPAELPPPRRGQRAGIVIAIVVLVLLIAGGITAVILKSNNTTSGRAWTPGHPKLHGPRVEQAMEQLENAVRAVKSG